MRSKWGALADFCDLRFGAFELMLDVLHDSPSLRWSILVVSRLMGLRANVTIISQPSKWLWVKTNGTILG